MRDDENMTDAGVALEGAGEVREVIVMRDPRMPTEKRSKPTTPLMFRIVHGVHRAVLEGPDTELIMQRCLMTRRVLPMVFDYCCLETEVRRKPVRIRWLLIDGRA